MTKQQAKDAYRRVREWERRQSEALRQEILLPHFGGCLCRLHNCRVNWETGILECEPARHKKLAELSALYDYRQRKIWDTGTRLQAAFAKHF